MKRGLLIVIESGSDGSGKATQTNVLYDKLKLDKFNVKKITFPNYDSPACMPVKMYLSGAFGKNATDVNAYAASTFYAIDRFASYKTDWGEFYNNGGIVLTDRYTTSNMVHQASKMAKSDRDEYLNWLYDLEYNHYGLPTPDLVLFLNVSPTVTSELIKNRANKFTNELEKDIHENNFEYLMESYNNSLDIVSKYGWINIDCVKDGNMRAIEDIHNEIYMHVTKLIERETSM